MTRMTNYLRDEIVKNALAKTPLDAEDAELARDRHALAEDFRIAALGGAEEAARLENAAAKIEKALSELPSSLVNSDYPVRRSEMAYRANLGGLRVNLAFPDARLCPSGLTFAGDHPLVCRFHELLNRETELGKRRNDLKTQVRAVLNSCTTVKKLLDVWPEAKGLLPQQLEEARPQLPAVQTADLNAALGLPPE